ncbi:MAG: hypothetical protein AAGH45_04305 [Pseudomonadota bacterium]
MHGVRSLVMGVAVLLGVNAADMRGAGAAEGTAAQAPAPETPAADVGERLAFPMPAGWKPVNRVSDADGTVVFAEFVPEAESHDRWSEMITLIVDPGEQFEPGAYAREMTRSLGQNCASTEVRRHQADRPLPYPHFTGEIICIGSIHRKTAQADIRNFEVLVFQAIQGADAFYMIQRAWHADQVLPDFRDSAKYREMLDFAEAIFLCDDRRPDRSCAAEGGR